LSSATGWRRWTFPGTTGGEVAVTSGGSAEALGELGGDPLDAENELLEADTGEAAHWAGDAHGRDHRAVGAENGGGETPDPFFHLPEVRSVAMPPDAVQRVLEPPDVGYGVRGKTAQTFLPEYGVDHSLGASSASPDPSVASRIFVGKTLISVSSPAYYRRAPPEPNMSI
jgi:hypothetical protein